MASFDPQYYTPPAVVGHPKDDAPAYGWVRALKKATTPQGKAVLLARFEDVAPEFAAMVRARRFPNRSAAFYPDGRLRHVGFLGAAPPAVKGLKKIDFADGAAANVFAFAERRASQPTNEEEAMKFSEFLQAINIFKKLGGKDEDIDLIAPNAPDPPAAGARFTEADLEAAKNEAAAQATQAAEAKFAEKETAAARKTRDADITRWVDDKVAAGVIPPAIREAGLSTFMQGLSDAAIEFAEGEEKQSPLAWFQGFLEQMGTSPLFKEIAGKQTAGDRHSDEAAEVKRGKAIAARVSPE